MYYYVDESGHTGANLFDSAQPVLCYGVLTSKKDLDAKAENTLSILRKKLSVERLHAAELGIRKLTEIANQVSQLQKQFNFRFSLYRVYKYDYAIICFFDQVFDQGLNPAVTWSSYWTPLRYFLLFKVAALFDDETLKKAWAARIEINDDTSHSLLVNVCKTLRSRVLKLPDERLRQLIGDALDWATQNPEKISYNVNSRKELLTVTPNIIGFQSVMHGIARDLRNRKSDATKIIVDQQSQFNKAQKDLAAFLAEVRNVPFVTGPGLPELDFKDIPTVPISFSSSKNSAGLELVDIYLWVINKHIEIGKLPPELFRIVRQQAKLGTINDISIPSLVHRWERWLENLPEPTNEALDRAKDMIEFDEMRRQQNMKIYAKDDA